MQFMGPEKSDLGSEARLILAEPSQAMLPVEAAPEPLDRASLADYERVLSSSSPPGVHDP